MRKIAILTLSVTAAGPIAASRFVGFDDRQVSAGGAVAMGVADYPASGAGKQLAVIAMGTAPIEAGAPLAKGQIFMADAAGRAVPVAGGGVVLGRSLQAVSAAGVVFEGLLIPSPAPIA